jgi:hypothetical protein
MCAITQTVGTRAGETKGCMTPVLEEAVLPLGSRLGTRSLTRAKSRPRPSSASVDPSCGRALFTNRDRGHLRGGLRTEPPGSIMSTMVETRSAAAPYLPPDTPIWRSEYTTGRYRWATPFSTHGVIRRGWA